VALKQQEVVALLEDGEPKAQTWDLNSAIAFPLAAASVFDARCAHFYVVDANTIAFVPTALEPEIGTCAPQPAQHDAGDHRAADKSSRGCWAENVAVARAWKTPLPSQGRGELTQSCKP
jgi:hypothetical protein